MNLDPQIPDRIIVGSDAGVFYSENGGGSWVSISQGIPNVPVTSMKIHNETRTLVIGTYGCSAYKINLDDIYVSSENVVAIEPIAKLYQNYPNPFSLSNAGRSPSTTISFSIQEDSRVDFDIYNIKGQKIKTLIADEQKEKGEHSLVWDGTDDNNRFVGSGTYLYKLIINNKFEISKRCILIK